MGYSLITSILLGSINIPTTVISYTRLLGKALRRFNFLDQMTNSLENKEGLASRLYIVV